MPSNRAVFLDRDGTINEEVKYLTKVEEIKFFPTTAEAIRLINESGMKAVVVTNQSGIARGFLDEERLHAIHTRISDMLQEAGAFIDRYYYCPHHPTAGNSNYRMNCDCRKPNPGMLLKAAAEMDIDLSRSYMVGDMIKDIQAGQRAEVRDSILVRTGYGQNIIHVGTPIYIADDILDAVTWILRDVQREHSDR